MTTDRHRIAGDQTAEAAPITDPLVQTPREFKTAGDLAALMAALPPDTPVSVAATIHVDSDLPAGAPTITANVAKAVFSVDPGPTDVVESDGRMQSYGPTVASVELGAVIAAEGSAMPEVTEPYQPFERALDALGLGDVVSTLAAQIKLLNWIADVIADEPTDTSRGTAGTVSQWVDDADLQEQLGIEARRLRHSAERLIHLRERIADDEVAYLERNAE